MSKLTDPASQPASTGNAVAFTVDGTRMAVGHAGSPYLSVYDTTVTPFAKLANPSSPPPTVDVLQSVNAYAADGTLLGTGGPS